MGRKERRGRRVGGRGGIGAHAICCGLFLSPTTDFHSFLTAVVACENYNHKDRADKAVYDMSTMSTSYALIRKHSMYYLLCCHTSKDHFMFSSRAAIIITWSHFMLLFSCATPYRLSACQRYLNVGILTSASLRRGTVTMKPTMDSAPITGVCDRSIV